MKVLSVLMLFVLLGVQASAQQEAKVIAEIAAGNEKMVKNAPFTAEAVSESVQQLADGNRIVRSSTSKLYRNSEGRFRREMAGGSGGVLGTYFNYAQGVSIMDPIAGYRVMLDDVGKTARLIELKGGQNVAIAGRAAMAKSLSEADRAQLEEKIRSSQNLSQKEREEMITSVHKARTKVEISEGATVISGQSPAAIATIDGAAGSYVYSTGPSHNRHETRTEDLGTRDFEGVSAAGTRRVTTIPAGAIGNERPIEIVYERWYSKELELVVYSKQSDPRFGEQTYRLTNIVRSEPDPSLFTIPQGYRTLNEPPSVYRIAPVPVRAATAPRTPVAPRAVNVSTTKP